MIAFLALAAFGPAPVFANGVGDLYATSPSGVLELHVATAAVVNTVEIAPQPQSLAFSPDGAKLFVASGGSHLSPIDIATLDVGEQIALPGNVAALAFPSGSTLVAALPARSTLALVRLPGLEVTESEALPGPGNLLAGDRHDARVAVAQAGKSWLEIVDPATSTFRRASVGGEIRAIAIERDRGGVLVATHAPDAVARIDLTTLAQTWTAPLSGTPTAVAAMTATDVVAVGAKVLAVSASGAKAFATPKSAPTVLAVSDEGKVLHASETARIEAFDATGKLVRTIDLAGTRAPGSLAAVPKGSSLLLAGGGGGDASASPGASARTGEPPSTSTIVDRMGSLMAEPPVQGALTVALSILSLCWLLVFWMDRRARSR